MNRELRSARAGHQFVVQLLSNRVVEQSGQVVVDHLSLSRVAPVLVGGIILLIGAFKIAMAPASGGGSLGSLLERLEHVEPGGACKIGFGWLFASPKQWVFVLTAVAVIFAADLRAAGSLANFVVFTLLVQAVYFVIIAGFALARDRVGRILDAIFGWIRAHLRPTAIGLFTVFGVIFLAKGFSALS